MYVLILAFGIALLLLFVESALLWMFTKRWSRTLRIIFQIGLVLATWPTLQIAGEVIFYLGTKDGYAHTIAEVPPKFNLPDECNEVHFHKDPTGEWFRCKIDGGRAEKWLTSESFVSYNALHCGPFGDLARESIQMQNAKSHKYYQTTPESNGAGKSALLSGDTLLVCQWYW